MPFIKGGERYCSANGSFCLTAEGQTAAHKASLVKLGIKGAKGASSRAGPKRRDKNATVITCLAPMLKHLKLLLHFSLLEKS